MQRKKEIVLLSHCILNCNSKVEGVDFYEGAQAEVINLLMAKGYGLIQLPCPEMSMYGIKRWGHVKEQFETLYYREHCKKIFEIIRTQIVDYLNNGYKIKAIIGIDGSPSCGVNKTCSSKCWGGELSNLNIADKVNSVQLVQGKGVFMDEIEKTLKELGIIIDFIGIDELNIKKEIEFLKNEL